MGNDVIKIQPELTAIHRKSPSYPLKQIFNYLEYDNKILDYGCGHGYDLCYLKELGFNIKGYDKYIKKYSEDINIEDKFDVINCFYVLNVIADENERIEVLSFIKNTMKIDSILYIAVRSIEEFKRFKGAYEIHNDGIVTRRKTFQKYFRKDELYTLIRKVFPYANICEIVGNKNTILLRVQEPYL